MTKKQEAESKLFEIALAQQGYFTYQQTREAGYAKNASYFHAKAGNWIHDQHKIYHLAKFPPADRPDLVIWSLWSADRKGTIQGVYSHQTALALYEISDDNPVKLHLTVPPGFRKFHPIPEGIVLHKAEIADSDKRKMQGYFVTTPLKTIQDMLDANLMDSAEAKVVAKKAIQKGILSPDQADTIKFPKDA